jgi:hypothetical protein
LCGACKGKGGDSDEAVKPADVPTINAETA